MTSIGPVRGVDLRGGLNMGFLDKIFGRTSTSRANQPTSYGPQSYDARSGQPYGTGAPGPQDGIGHTGATEDERAIARYRYLLRTAPPEKLEEVHAHAFGQLSPAQRQQVLGRLRDDLPEGEAPHSDEPREMARAATRAELMRPGYMYSAFGPMSMGGMMMGSLFSTIAGVVIGSAIADALFDGYDSSPEAAEAGEYDASADPGADAGSDASSDAGSNAGTDAGSDAGSDAGGGDFGTGDFGGGDFGGDFGGF